MDKKPMTLANLGGGAAAEKFDDELRRVLENILDPNTDGGEREVVLRVRIKPDKDRRAAAVAITCSAKLGGLAAFETQMFIGRDGGRAVAVEHNPRQANLFTDTQANVVDIGAKKEAAK